MANKTLKTKIALLYKTYAEWAEIQESYIPLKGEVCFCEVPAEKEVAAAPCILFKVGDGIETFSNLPWSSALAADVYAWAKKENLDWSDMTDDFKQGILDLIGGEETNTLYKIVSDGDNKWKLMKSEDHGTTWEDAEGTIDLSATIAALEAKIAKKVDKELVGDLGKSLIFNEKDGGGSKFEGNNGVIAYVGTHDNIGGEIGTQIYVDKADGSGSTIIDITQNGAYYTKGTVLPGTQRDVEDNELVTKKDIKDLIGVLHFRGVFESLDDVENPKHGDVVLVGTKEYVYVVEGSLGRWHLLGDEGTYATKVELSAEQTAREAADAELNSKINAETARAEAAEAQLGEEKLNVLPKVDDPEDPGFGWEYHIPYSFDAVPDAEKLNITLKTLTLDNKVTKMNFEKSLPGATEDTAGLMTAADKVRVDKALMEDDYLILDCNL